MPIRIRTPIEPQEVSALNAGDEVLISGSILTARDVAHQRLCRLIEERKELPLDLEGQIIYFTGPAPPKPGKPTGSAGPTTSCRMDAFSPILIASAGIRGMIGKGNRSEEVIQAMRRYGCVYFAAVGGAGALIAATIKSASIVCYEDLGPEAIRRLEVVDFPAIVAIDSRGRNLYSEGPARYKERMC